MKSNDFRIVTRGNEILLDTVRALLTAEPDTRGSNLLTPLMCLMDVIYFLEDEEMLDSSYASARASQCRLGAEIVHMLVLHGVCSLTKSDMIKYQFLGQLYFNTILLHKTLASGTHECSDQLYSVMDSMGDMYRCILLSGFGKNLFQCYTEEGSYSIKRFTERVATLVGYSFQPGQSRRLIRQIMNNLNSSQVNELKKALVECLESMSEDTPDEQRTSTQKALEWISGLATPRNLQHQARHTILHTMSNRAMRGVQSQPIPRHLKPYLLLKSD